MSDNFFGQYLRKLRKGKGLTLKQLGQLSELSDAYICQIEKGNRGIPKPEYIKKLADPLGVSKYHLMIAAGHWVEKDEGVDLSTILFNDSMTFKGIPLTEAQRMQLLSMTEVLFQGGKGGDV